MIDFDLCKGCIMFEKQKEFILNQCDSVFDAAVEMQDFITDCKKTCDKTEVNKDE